MKVLYIVLMLLPLIFIGVKVADGQTPEGTGPEVQNTPPPVSPAPPVYGQPAGVPPGAPGQPVAPAPPGAPIPPGPAAPPPGPVMGPPVPGAFIPQLPQNLSSILNVARKAKPYFQLGGIWTTRAPAGEIEIKAAIVYQGFAIAALRFNPADGTLLPLGYNPHVYNMNASLDAIRARAIDIVKNIEILNGAEYREPEAVWAIPLSYNGKIVAHIKVKYDGSAIVPDYPLDQEMRYFVRR